MAFTSGQRVTAAALNRIIRNDLVANVTSDDTLTTSEVDLSGATLSVTTTEVNTKLKITASLDSESSGASDFAVIRVYIAGVLASSTNFIWQASGRFALSKTWVLTVATTGTKTVKLTRQKIGTANTVKVYSGHSTFVVSGNGIS